MIPLNEVLVRVGVWATLSFFCMMGIGLSCRLPRIWDVGVRVGITLCMFGAFWGLSFLRTPLGVSVLGTSLGSLLTISGVLPPFSKFGFKIFPPHTPKERRIMVAILFSGCMIGTLLLILPALGIFMI